MKNLARGTALLLSLLWPGAQALAGEADVVAVDVFREAGGTYRFDVAVRHGDTGWDHYADAWTVSAPDGTVLGTRTLFHPHVEEQPFTRSQSGIVIPDGVDTVIVRAHDKVHEWGGTEIEVAVPR